MRSSPKKVFLCLVGVLVLAGFGGTPNCADDDVKNTILKLEKDKMAAIDNVITGMQQNCTACAPVASPIPFSELYGLLGEATRNLRNAAQTAEGKCNIEHRGPECHQAVDNWFHKVMREAQVSAAYSVKTIRLTGKDQTTGAVSCAADLYVTIPKELGGDTAKEPITYVIEKLLDEDGFHVTVQGLQ